MPVTNRSGPTIPAAAARPEKEARATRRATSVAGLSMATVVGDLSLAPVVQHLDQRGVLGTEPQRRARVQQLVCDLVPIGAALELRWCHGRSYLSSRQLSRAGGAAAAGAGRTGSCPVVCRWTALSPRAASVDRRRCGSHGSDCAVRRA